MYHLRAALEGTSPTATLGEKGSASISKAGDSRNDTICHRNTATVNK